MADAFLLFTVVMMVFTIYMLYPSAPYLSVYFAGAWLYNAVAAQSMQRPFTINSLTATRAWSSSRTLLAVALFESALLAIGERAQPAWLLVGLFTVVLLCNGVLMHLLIPYAGGPLQLEKGTEVTFHSSAWIGAVLSNVYGTGCHVAVIYQQCPLARSAPLAAGFALITLYAARKTRAKTIGVMRDVRRRDKESC